MQKNRRIQTAAEGHQQLAMGMKRMRNIIIILTMDARHVTGPGPRWQGLLLINSSGRPSGSLKR
jgi:hypothetical protein